MSDNEFSLKRLNYIKGIFKLFEKLKIPINIEYTYSVDDFFKEASDINNPNEEIDFMKIGSAFHLQIETKDSSPYLDYGLERLNSLTCIINELDCKNTGKPDMFGVDPFDPITVISRVVILLARKSLTELYPKWNELTNKEFCEYSEILALLFGFEKIIGNLPKLDNGEDIIIKDYYSVPVLSYDDLGLAIRICSLIKNIQFNMSDLFLPVSIKYKYYNRHSKELKTIFSK